MKTRVATDADLQAILSVYKVLEGPWTMAEGERAEQVWDEILTHSGTSAFIGEVGERPVAAATLHVMPNLTFSARSYALIENVAVAEAYQGNGYGRQIMQAAMDAAWEAGCYKIMLMTGVSNNTKGFYESLGFSSDQKHAMVIRRAPMRHER